MNIDNFNERYKPCYTLWPVFFAAIRRDGNHLQNNQGHRSDESAKHSQPPTLRKHCNATQWHGANRRTDLFSSHRAALTGHFSFLLTLIVDAASCTASRSGKLLSFILPHIHPTMNGSCWPREGLAKTSAMECNSVMSLPPSCFDGWCPMTLSQLVCDHYLSRGMNPGSPCRGCRTSLSCCTHSAVILSDSSVLDAWILCELEFDSRSWFIFFFLVDTNGGWEFWRKIMSLSSLSLEEIRNSPSYKNATPSPYPTTIPLSVQSPYSPCILFILRVFPLFLLYSSCSPYIPSVLVYSP